MLSAQLWAANTKTSVEQVTTAVTLTDDVDYVITSATPFSGDGMVNIQNTDHAVVILAAVKPSKAKSILSSRIQIAGKKAVDGTNCQLKLYNRGCIILPYDKNLKPLTVYAEQNFEGEQSDDFGLEHTGGFMNTLSDGKLNNRIRSFKLKRGYMVTFSLRAGGRGYSRCFIAADSDLEMASLPAIMDRSISSYRVFTWYDTGKPQLAATDATACGALNVTSTYTWGTTSSMAPDIENVPHHIYENYPSPSALGACTTSPHMKTNNEPMNTADDPKGKTEDVDAVLANWEDLMRTGMRICTPSSWDGSDYTNGTGYLKRFLDSIDARGWRCDIIDLHCYWPESNFSTIKNWVNSCHRPIWISEWCWGASWNKNGAFASGVTQNQVRDALSRICNSLNSYDYVERYYYWNHEADISKLYKNGQLTPAGQMYAQLDGGVGYNGKYDYVPKAPRQQAPADLVVDFDSDRQTATISWMEYNGEMNDYIHLECLKTGSSGWEVVADVTGGEEAGRRVLTDVPAQQGWEFRIREKDAVGKLCNTNVVMAASGNMKAGDAVDIDGQTWYLGGNVLTNGDFDFALTGWVNGMGDSHVGQPWFETIAQGGSNGGAYLQCYGNGTIKSDESMQLAVDGIEANTSYYFAAAVAENEYNTCRVVLSADGEALDSTVMRLTQAGSNWQTLFATFGTGRFTNAIITLNRLGNKARFDNMMLCRLFEQQSDAIADGLKQEQQRAMTAIASLRTPLALSLQQQLDGVEGMSDSNDGRLQYLRASIDQAIASQRAWPALEYLWQYVGRLLDMQLLYDGYDAVKEAYEAAGRLLTVKGALPSTASITKGYEALSAALDAYMPMTTLSSIVQNPTFAATAGWTPSGTYGDGEQGISSGDGYYRALWTIKAEGNEQQTMGIRQQVDGLSHGLYAVACDATTWHYSLTDQHAYISNGTDSLATPTLSADYLDLPGMADSLRWQTLLSQPVYVEEDGSVVIGFEGSKQGAQDLAWREVGNSSSRGDYREGSWAVTNFQLIYHPLYRQPAGSQWGVACLPYAVAPHPDMTYYNIVAITSDYHSLCLEPVERVDAGVPFIWYTKAAVATMPEYGDAVARASDGAGNLRGFFKTAARVPVGYFVLGDGKWTKVTDSSNRPRMAEFSAIMRPLNDKQSLPIPVVSNWSGATMPIEGITDEEIADGITLLQTTTDDSRQLFTLGGQRVEQQPKAGVYIQISNGKSQKIIIK